MEHLKDLTLADLVPDQRNARKHFPRNIDMITKSLQEVGAARSIVIDEENNILAGNGTVEALADTGIEKVRVIDADGSELIAVRRTGLSAEQKAKLALYDNRTAELADWDPANMKLLQDDMPEIFAKIFSDDELKAILDVNLDETTALDGQDEAIAPPPDPRTQPGDLFKLGQHSLLCGDSTDKASVDQLMAGIQAQMVFTDPPYNVDYGASKLHPNWKIRTIKGDKQTPEEWQEFCGHIFERFKENCAGDVYMWGGSGAEGSRMRLWLHDIGCHWSATIIWKKQKLVLTPAKYQRIYEPCFYGWFGKSSFRADRKQVEVWEIDRNHVSDLHPTMKPVALCEQAIVNSCEAGQVVMDLFGGAGSTLIACQKLQRVCRMMEIDPGYCDVIVTRFTTLFPDEEIQLNGEPIEWQPAEVV